MSVEVPAGEKAASAEPPRKPSALRYLFTGSRVLIVIAILVLFIASILVVVTGIAELYRITMHLVEGGLFEEGVGTYLAVNMTELIDLFLIGIALITFALGLFQLFIEPDIDLPEWLNTSSLDTLKTRLLVVIVALLPVIFLGAAYESEGGVAIAGLGIGIAAVMIAIGYIISLYIKSQVELRKMMQQNPDEI